MYKILTTLIMVFSLILTVFIFNGTEEIKEILGTAYATKVSNIVLFLISLFISLRALDFVIQRKFKVINTADSIYYAVRFFAISLALALIIM
jgi:hypothetical protein